MKILLVGGGGREHALAENLRRSPHTSHVYVAPGNAGTAAEDESGGAGGDAGGDARAGCAPVSNVQLAAIDVAGLLAFARREGIGLTVVGPEAPLAEGIVDAFAGAGLAIFGPSRAAAQIEASKAFSKAFMQRHGIPTAHALSVTDLRSARAALAHFSTPPVIKASGLAGGKGVMLPASQAEAEEALRRLLIAREFGEAGATVLVEERLTGPEVSVLAFCDGTRARMMPACQDHKRLLDGDGGPNTGGMGAYAPAPLLTPELQAQVQAQVLQPTLEGMAREGAPYVGVLYAGLMLTPDGVRVLEFNCRLGDPEAQALLPLLESDLVEVALACLQGRLDEMEVRWRAQAAVAVVMAAGGYPGAYVTGTPIGGIAEAQATGCQVFHAGTARNSRGQLVTVGGRVLTVTGVAETLADARAKASAGVERIHFEGAHYRRDIAART